MKKVFIENGTEVLIEDLTFGGKAICRQEGLVIMIDGALPGQRVRINIKSRRRRYAEAVVTEVLARSPYETEVPYQDTPGAPWIRLKPEYQRKYKQMQIYDLFRKTAHTDAEAVFDEYIESPLLYGYRNKMEYSFGYTQEAFDSEEKKFSRSGFGLGSRKRGNFILVENLDRPSGIFNVNFETQLPRIREFCLQSGLPPYDTKKNIGFYRYLRVRRSFSENKFILTLYTHSDYSDQFRDEQFLTVLKDILGERLKGYTRCNYDHMSDAFMADAVPVYTYGEDYLTEKINGLAFKISSGSFFQTNPACAEKLYAKALSYLDGLKNGTVLDLYCGTGTISRVIASAYPECRVTGVESAEEAVRDARLNAQADVTPPEFITADVKDFLASYRRPQAPLSVVLDPPRAGIDPKPLQAVLNLKADRIVYISCNPSTLARDTEIILKQGYTFSKLSAADQFPHTPHIECVARFDRQ